MSALSQLQLNDSVNSGYRIAINESFCERAVHRRTWAVTVLLFASTCVGSTAVAEEVALLAGLTETQDPTRGTSAWGLEYRQPLLAHLDATLGYLNEGHFAEAHRDGGALMLWATTGSWSDRFTFCLGAGPYLYFDTRFQPDYQGYSNQHGVGVIVGGRASYSFSRHWFVLLDLNKILATDLATRSLMLGVGYRLDRNVGGSASQKTDQSNPVSDARNEVNFFVGQTTLNNLYTPHQSIDLGIEYRYRAARHIELSAALLGESDGAYSRHASLIAEVWLVQDFLERRLVAGLGIGPYVALSNYQVSVDRTGASLVGLLAMTFSWRFTRTLDLRFTWQRAFTEDDEDRDIVTLGLGWRF